MFAVETKWQKSSLWQAFSQRRFGILLIILIVLLAGPVLLGFGRLAEWLDLLMSLLVLAVIISLCFEPHQRLFALLLGLPTIALSLGGRAFSGDASAWAILLGDLFKVAFFFGAAVLVVRSLFSNEAVSFDSIIGAACGYLFVGLGWAVCYVMIERLRPGSFALSPSLTTPGEHSQLLPQLLTYYSFVTLTTVGYGDVSPVAPAARTLSWMEAIAGQFYLAVIVAGLVSMIVSNSLRANAANER
jgi:ion channel